MSVKKPEYNVELLFKENYELLCLIAFSIVKDKDVAKDIVQDFFVSFCQKKEKLQLHISFRAYATKAVKNLCLLSLKKAEKERNILRSLDYSNPDVTRSGEKTENTKKIFHLLNKLPEKRRKVFVLSALQGYSYAEIAKSENISINTVKTQVKRAYLFLRTKLLVDTPDLGDKFQ